MASWAKPAVRTPTDPKRPTLVPPIEIKFQSVGPGLPRVEAPEGCVKKVERAREGKVWVGYFHIWETTRLVQLNDEAIYGVAILQGQPPDSLLRLGVRLHGNMKSLESQFIQYLEAEAGVRVRS